MKRRTKSHVGAWPNMRDDTLKAIAEELVRARKKHPNNIRNLDLLIGTSRSLAEELNSNNLGRMTAVQVYARAAQVAAMAIRILEEGSAGFKYAGNSGPPAFGLEP